jgi:aerobic-type carbon monoxide dehydrogenase small subunit (CoxS/CutS family)
MCGEEPNHMSDHTPGHVPEDPTPATGASAPEPKPGESATSRRNLLVGGAVAVGGVAVAAVAFEASRGGSSKSAASTSTTTAAAPATSAPATSAAAPVGTAAAPSTTAAATGPTRLTLNINGEAKELTSDPDTMLLYVLRDEVGLKGPKFGCGLAQCGACAVLSDGKQIRSCVTPASAVTKAKIVTLDALGDVSDKSTTSASGQKVHPLQQAWIDEQVPQCGYCQNGMIIQAADLLATNPSPSDAEIRTAMDGHLCRCGTYSGIIRAIQRAAKVMA